MTEAKKLEVLIIEDDPNARMLAARTIEKLGVIHLAENGYEGMHIFTKNPNISLVLLDLIMPGIDGWTTYQEIRRQNWKVPVIILSGFASGRQVEKFGEQKPDLLLSKPYSPNYLRNAASRLLNAS